METMLRKACLFVLHHLIECLTNPPGTETAAKGMMRKNAEAAGSRTKRAKGQKKEKGFGPNRATEPEAMSRRRRKRWWMLPKAGLRATGQGPGRGPPEKLQV